MIQVQILSPTIIFGYGLMALTNENKECVKEYIKILVDTAKKCGCPKCKGEVEQVKNRIFRCKKGCGDFIIDPKLIKKFRDSFDSMNWKATCDECGGTMDYYNFKYCCRKCGSILEV